MGGKTDTAGLCQGVAEAAFLARYEYTDGRTVFLKMYSGDGGAFDAITALALNADESQLAVALSAYPGKQVNRIFVVRVTDGSVASKVATFDHGNTERGDIAYHAIYHKGLFFDPSGRIYVAFLGRTDTRED